MKTLKFETRDEWLFGRIGKITGTRLKDIVVKRGTGKKIGYYELIAERLGVPPDGENPMERGARLEAEAIERFIVETGKNVDTSLVIWTRDDNENIAISPDGIVSEEEAVEVKCLSSARHIEALLTNSIPDEYEYQVLQYFIVNENLKTLNVVCYDPRFVALYASTGSKKQLDFFVIEVKRESLTEQITEYLEYERKTLAEVEQIVNQLTF
jgi:predicted phage-related endonuclease